MKEPISFFVAGIAKPAGSKRAFVLKKGGVYTGRAVVTDDCKKSKDWKTDVKRAAIHHYRGDLWTCPISLTLRFIVTRPKGHYGTGKNAHLLRDSAPPFPLSKPDTTKLVRGVEDALTSIVWKDDAQVVTQRATKRYGDAPGVQVIIREEGEA
jgi:Holliday junction resolvase RusA-like endonuclease